MGVVGSRAWIAAAVLVVADVRGGMRQRSSGGSSGWQRRERFRRTPLNISTCGAAER